MNDARVCSIIKIQGMICRACTDAVAQTITQTRGVVDADVAYVQSLVTVKYDPALVSEETLREVLEELGYPSFDRRPSVLERVAAKLKHLGGSA